MTDSIISAELRKRLRDWMQTADQEYTCKVDFDADFAGFEGHFPGNPIVPGVCLIELSRVLAEQAAGHDLLLEEITLCKFRRPIMAGMTADCKLLLRPLADSAFMIQTEIKTEGSPAGQMRLKAKIRP
ncbi:MAG: hypothetical protein J5806_10265 [Lentisphaeria bacterium]|nr:hypothetical protein [Lentisphaeria bacterium]